MSAFPYTSAGYWWPVRRTPAPVAPREPFNYNNVAPWLRGRVTLSRHTASGRAVFLCEVVNTTTGETIQWDDAYSLTEAITDASRTTAAARACWFHDFRQKKVDGSRSKMAKRGELLSGVVR